MPRWALPAVAAVVILAVAAWLLVLPALRRMKVADFATLNSSLDCCGAGYVRTECKEALDELIALAGKAPLARAQVDACPVAREMDPRVPHPPEEKLCGWLASFDERRTAARALGDKLVAAAVAPKCRPEGRDAALAIVVSDFEKLCAKDACVALLAAVPEDPKTRRAAQAHAQEIFTQLLARKDLSDDVQRALLNAAYPETWQAIWALLHDEDANATALAPFLQGDQLLLGPAKQLAAQQTPAGARASLLLYARGMQPLTAGEQAKACEASSCGFLGAFTGDQLHLEDPARKAACNPRISTCHLFVEEADAGVTLPFALADPDRADPVGGMSRCLGLILGCAQRAALDACWKDVVTCETSKPWTEATPCCPPACAKQYKAARDAGKADREAFTSLAKDRSCFPGVSR